LIQLSGYNFLQFSSPTCAGGVRIYVKSDISYNIRSDLNLGSPNCEDIWLKIFNSIKSNLN